MTNTKIQTQWHTTFASASPGKKYAIRICIDTTFFHLVRGDITELLLEAKDENLLSFDVANNALIQLSSAGMLTNSALVYDRQMPVTLYLNETLSDCHFARIAKLCSIIEANLLYIENIKKQSFIGNLQNSTSIDLPLSHFKIAQLYLNNDIKCRHPIHLLDHRGNTTAKEELQQSIYFKKLTNYMCFEKKCRTLFKTPPVEDIDAKTLTQPPLDFDEAVNRIIQNILLHDSIENRTLCLIEWIKTMCVFFQRNDFHHTLAICTALNHSLIKNLCLTYYNLPPDIQTTLNKFTSMSHYLAEKNYTESELKLFTKPNHKTLITGEEFNPNVSLTFSIIPPIIKPITLDIELQKIGIEFYKRENAWWAHVKNFAKHHYIIAWCTLGIAGLIMGTYTYATLPRYETEIEMTYKHMDPLKNFSHTHIRKKLDKNKLPHDLKMTRGIDLPEKNPMFTRPTHPVKIKQHTSTEITANLLTFKH